jgi:hypothetical protein
MRAPHTGLAFLFALLRWANKKAPAVVNCKGLVN